jgi:excisionase family DNA binding protein
LIRLLQATYEVTPMTRQEYLLAKEAADLRLTLSRKEACQILGIQRSKIDQLLKAKALASYKDTSGRRRIHTDSVYSYESARAGGPEL